MSNQGNKHSSDRYACDWLDGMTLEALTSKQGYTPADDYKPLCCLSRAHQSLTDVTSLKIDTSSRVTRLQLEKHGRLETRGIVTSDNNGKLQLNYTWEVKE